MGKGYNLTEENYKIITESDSGLTVAMTFGDDILKSYQLQLKILYTIVANMAGVVDFCGEKVLSSVWVKLAAETEMEVDLNHLTDWILYTPDGEIIPDNVYLLEEAKN